MLVTPCPRCGKPVAAEALPDDSITCPFCMRAMIVSGAASVRGSGFSRKHQRSPRQLFGSHLSLILFLLTLGLFALSLICFVMMPSEADVLIAKDNADIAALVDRGQNYRLGELHLDAVKSRRSLFLVAGAIFIVAGIASSIFTALEVRRDWR